MSAIINSGNMDQMIAAYGSEYLIAHGLILPVACGECGGSGEFLFNNDPRRDPINDEAKPCECCNGTGKTLELVEPVNEDEQMSEIVTPVENVPLQKRPVAFRVPTGDSWLLMLSEEAAQIEADRRGVEYDGLYVRSED